jgi:hypothetical protein
VFKFYFFSIFIICNGEIGWWNIIFNLEHFITVFKNRTMYQLREADVAEVLLLHQYIHLSRSRDYKGNGT